MTERSNGLRIAAFAAYSLPVVAVTAPMGSYLPAYYNQATGISLTTIGLVFLFLRLFDVVCDVVMGTLVDYNPWPRGKYRPWIMLSIPLIMIGVYFMYLIDERMISPPLLLAGGIVIYIGYTMATLSHQAWGAERLAGTRDMSLFFGYREIYVVVGIMAAFVIPAIVEARGGIGFAPKVQAVGLFLAITLPLAAAATLFAGRDMQATRAARHFSVGNIKKVLADRMVLGLFLSQALLFVGLIAVGTLNPFLVSYYFGFEGYYARIQALYFLAALVSVFFWIWLSRRVGDTATYKIALAFLLASHLLVLIVALWPSAALLSVYFAITGLGFGAGPYLLRAMAGQATARLDATADVNARGTVYAILTLCEKLGGAVAVGVSLPLLEFLGFSPQAANARDASGHVLLLYLAFPLAAYGFMIWVFAALMRRPTPSPSHAEMLGPNSSGIGQR